MNSEVNEMALVPVEENADETTIGELTSKTVSFCSLKAESNEEKANLYNAINNPDKRLSDCINETITVKDIFCEIVPCTNRDSGEVSRQPRIVLIDENGTSYQCVSIGVFSAVRKLIAIFGMPTWTSGIPLTIRQVSKGDRKMLTLNVGGNFNKPKIKTK